MPEGTAFGGTADASNPNVQNVDDAQLNGGTNNDLDLGPNHDSYNRGVDLRLSLVYPEPIVGRLRAVGGSVLLAVAVWGCSKGSEAVSEAAAGDSAANARGIGEPSSGAASSGSGDMDSEPPPSETAADPSDSPSEQSASSQTASSPTSPSQTGSSATDASSPAGDPSAITASPDAGSSLANGTSAEPGACGLVVFHGPNYVLSILGTGELASLEISTEDFNAVATSESPASLGWSNVVAEYFKDVFFWHVYVLHEHPPVSGGPLAQCHRVRRAAEGANLGDGSGGFVAQTQLMSVLYLSDDKQLSSSTLLHEMAHTWGNRIVPEMTDEHWEPLADVGGLLGGYPRGSIRDLGNNRYAANTGDTLGETLAADIEMYLMGLWPKERVQPFHWVAGVTYESTDPDTFDHVYLGTSLETVTVDDVIAAYGERIPDSTTSRRDFRLMPVIVTDTPLSAGDFDFYRWQLQALSAADPVPAYDPNAASYFSPPNFRRQLSTTLRRENFRAVMHGEATLQSDGLLDTLLEPAAGECAADLPARGSACARLTARAATCGITVQQCAVDTEFTPTDGECIAQCAEQASCADLQQAAEGSQLSSGTNPYLSCASACQCTSSRMCQR